MELHHRALVGYGLALESEPLLAHAQEAELEGRRVRYLRAEEELVYLCLHASNHLLQRLSWLFDVKLLLLAHPQPALVPGGGGGEGHGVLPPRVVRAGVREPPAGAPMPEDARGLMAPPRWQRVLARRFFSEERLLETRMVSHRAEWATAKLLLAPRAGPMARYGLWRLGEAARARWRWPHGGEGGFRKRGSGDGG